MEWKYGAKKIYENSMYIFYIYYQDFYFLLKIQFWLKKFCNVDKRMVWNKHILGGIWLKNQ